MRKRARLAVSVAAGVMAMMLSHLAVEDVRAQAAQAERAAIERYGGELSPACVATRQIEPGEKIDDANVQVVDWMATLLPQDALTSMGDVAGKTATSRIPKGAPLSSAYFERERRADRVPEGKVALSVASDPEHAVGGSLERGDVVDVYIARDSIADRLAHAVVLDTSALRDESAEVTWVTLAVDPQRVEELLCATGKGMVWLVDPGESPGGDGSEDDGDREGVSGRLDDGADASGGARSENGRKEGGDEGDETTVKEKRDE